MGKPRIKSLARTKHNQDIIRRMKSGESLSTVDTMSSWFPPRPIIAKDPKELKKLYQLNDSTQPDGPTAHNHNSLE